MRYSRGAGRRRTVVADTAAESGTGVQVSDGRVLYVYRSGSNLCRGWASSGAAIVGSDYSVTGTAIATGGSEFLCSVSIANGRLLMFVIVRGTALSSTAKHPGASLGVTCFESADNGDTWTALGSASSSGYGTSALDYYTGYLGAISAPGPITYFGGYYYIAAPYFGNYFGSAYSQARIYYSSNGASWSIDGAGGGTVWASEWSRNLVEYGGVLYAELGDDDIRFPDATFPRRMWSTTTPGGGSLFTTSPYPGGALARSATEWWRYENGVIYRVSSDFSTNVELISKLSGTDGKAALVTLTTGDRTVAFHGRKIDLLTGAQGWKLGRLAMA